MEPIIQIEHLGKCYRISHETREPYQTLREAIVRLPRKLFSRSKTTHEDFWALDDVTLDINPGERVGIIGRNGAGKSTLLKVLSRITAPTKGRITMDGRVASLLEVGTGFHQELSGRDNIFLNGAVLGMTRAEVRRRFDEIVAFSGVEQFLDTPVKRYSSGMYVRLAFAVAAHLESEILIIDEVLSVGDAEFQKKCLGKMDDISRSEGRTLLFVSHNMGAIQQLCNVAVVLSGGKVAFHGEASAAIQTYVDNYSTTPEMVKKDRATLAPKNQFVTAYTADTSYAPVSQFPYDGQIRVCFELHLPEWHPSLVVSFSPMDKQHRRIFTIDVPLDAHHTGDRFVKLCITMPGETLVPGNYSWMLYIHQPLVKLYEHLDGVCDFSILETGSPFAKYAGHDYGVVYPPKVLVEPRESV
ncbi:MAG: polysaccharide ABC transporter ATP-binding protein [Kofleriaceae bacterium]